ncbi:MULTISPECIES: DNA cytosine methyltransferase [unclassified Mycoplasma]|uniref:DNA cytosine methyltransferase n=1 Tax=unclassified Mycoplasma TaxID=2683645 RepID=UPI00211CB6B7|nr:MULTISPECIES: DNA cytosine methyltransferase [unclassified Mycoplasma]UUM19684.1 DNA cytosine methyltransferase [Mycoplasma sp. 1578d]UUM24667.1 DNA cytosine methyltransferase [Mycoplasma sp. 3686d]
MKKLICASFFSGVGGIDLGFREFCSTMYANEYNPKPAQTFEINFNLKVDVRDIRDISSDQIPDFDILLAGFPCQAFSIAGYRQGFNDEKGRGNLFFEIELIILDKKPSVVFLENVKNLVSHDKGNTFKVILSKLEQAGYYVKYKVLNTMEYGNTPQNRERIYIVGFKNQEHYNKFEFPSKIPLTTFIRDIVDFKNKLDSKYYYTKDNFKHFELLSQEVISKKSIYQWRRKYVRENKSNVCTTLTASCGTGGHNVPIVYIKFGIRKLTSRECFKFQGFGDVFKLPNQANSHLYKQAGNSVSVNVIKRIAKQIYKVMS